MPTRKNTKKSTKKPGAKKTADPIGKASTKSNVQVKLTIRKAKDLPASYRALDSVRKELKGDVAALRSDMQAGFKKVDARFNQVDARFNPVDAQLKEMNANIETMNAKIGRMLTLYEEQNTRNQASFEGAESVKERQESLTKRVEVLDHIPNCV